MSKGNVLVIGNSGVGKSTLINAVLGEDRAETSWGVVGTTRELKLYEAEDVPFRIIDSVGFEPSYLKQQTAINAVKKWSIESTKKGHEDTSINVIWFCVDGVAAKLFPKTIKDFIKATSIWKSIPIITVITKSFSAPDKAKNITMATESFNKVKGAGQNLKAIIPVLAKPYYINETAFAPPEGITELIEATNSVMPEGIKGNAKDIARIKLQRKQALSQAIVGTATVAGVVVGAIPIPFSDAVLLGPTEFAMFNALASTYEINKDEKSKQLFNSIVEAGTVGVVAKAALSGLKAIPGINLAASALNAIVAGVIIALLGEASIQIFQQIYLGEKSVSDVDWATKIIDSKFATQFTEKLKGVLSRIAERDENYSIAQIISDIFAKNSKEIC